MRISDNQRYDAAVAENLQRCVEALCQLRALQAIERNFPGLYLYDFFAIAHGALQDSMLSNAIRVLDRNSQSATFWYIARCNEKPIGDILATKGIPLSDFEEFADRCRAVRDTVHFHLDRKAILDPTKPWREAKFKREDFEYIVRNLIGVLGELHQAQIADSVWIANYQGEDIDQILADTSRALLDTIEQQSIIRSQIRDP